MRKAGLKRWSRYIAATLGAGDSAELEEIAVRVMSRLDEFEESSVIAASILTRRMCRGGGVKPKFWTYSKPSRTPPQIEEITEAAAAMHCIDIDLLDILLLCNCLEYDFEKAAAFLGERDVKERYIGAMHTLIGMIEFEPSASPEEKEGALLSLMQGIGDEIRLSASKKETAYFFRRCAANAYGRIKRCGNRAVQLGKGLVRGIHSIGKKRSRAENNSVITAEQGQDAFNKQLKANLKKSIAAFVLLDSIVIISLLIIWIVSQDVFSKNRTNEYQHTLDNTNGGIYYELTHLPAGYKLSEHIITPLSAKAIYTDSSNNQIAFTQLVSEKEIKSFKTSDNYSIVQQGNRKIAVYEAQDITELYWFNKNYAYTLTAGLDKDVMLKLAEGIRLAVNEVLPLEYTEYLAEENGDINADEVQNKDKRIISRIAESFSEGIEDSIRIVHYNGAYPEIITVEVGKDYVYCKKDARRIKSGEQELEIGKAYDSLEIISSRNNKSSLVAKEHDTGRHITLITF